MGERTMLSLLQRLHAAFAAAIVLVGLVGATMPGVLDLEPSLGGTAALALVLAAVAASTVGGQALDRPLPVTDAGALIGAFRTRLMLRIAMAELPVLVGFAASMLAAAPGPALLGLGATAVRLLLVAPSRAAVEAESEQLRMDGSALDLAALLTAPLDGAPPSGAGPIA